jgi:hypothetical protein
LLKHAHGKPIVVFEESRNIEALTKMVEGYRGPLYIVETGNDESTPISGWDWWRKFFARYGVKAATIGGAKLLVRPVPPLMAMNEESEHYGQSVALSGCVFEAATEWSRRFPIQISEHVLPGPADVYKRHGGAFSPEDH